MKYVNRLFGGLSMTWWRVLAFAAVTGIYSGDVMLVPFFKETSFQDIGISYEWWVIFALIVVTNCSKSVDAMLKCFAFFLVSQPLVYAVEIAAGGLSFSQAWLYYRQMWLPMTVLTLPGGWIAYYCQKQNALGSIILALGNVIQLGLGLVYGISVAAHFPHHLISAVVCFGSAVVMTWSIQKKTKYRLLSLGLAVGITAAVVIVAKCQGLYLVSEIF